MTPRVPIDPNARLKEPLARHRSPWRALVLDYVKGVVRTLQRDFSQWQAIHPSSRDPHE
jgi:hypothetical protein